MWENLSFLFHILIVLQSIIFFQAGSQLRSKLSINQHATAMSNMLLKGFSNNIVGNDPSICKTFGSLPVASNGIATNGCGTNAIPFSNFNTLGLTADHLQVTRPRMRICFDPETEIPRLQKWFAENNHPTRQQVNYLI